LIFSQKAKVKLISAREECGMDCLQDPTLWKMRCFKVLHAKFELRTDLLCNLIVVGDSMYEILAGISLSEQLPYCVPKLVKMLAEPTTD
jgi:hypothetical protein